MSKYFVASHALIEKDGKFLATRRSEVNDYMPLKWDLPGGTVEDGESLEQGLHREVMEETGLVIKVGKPIYIFNTNNPERPTLQMVYACHYVSGEVRLDPEEHDEFVWSDLDSLNKLDAIPFLEGLLKSGNVDWAQGQ